MVLNPWASDLTPILMFFALIFGNNFCNFNLENCVPDDSCREILVPTSPNGSKIQDAAVISVQRCTL